VESHCEEEYARFRRRVGFSVSQIKIVTPRGNVNINNLQYMILDALRKKLYPNGDLPCKVRLVALYNDSGKYLFFPATIVNENVATQTEQLMLK